MRLSVERFDRFRDGQWSIDDRSAISAVQPWRCIQTRTLIAIVGILSSGSCRNHVFGKVGDGVLSLSRQFDPGSVWLVYDGVLSRIIDRSLGYQQSFGIHYLVHKSLSITKTTSKTNIFHSFLTILLLPICLFWTNRNLYKIIQDG